MTDATATKANTVGWPTPPAGFDPAAGRVVRTDPPRRPKGFVFWSGPWYTMGSRRWTLALGVRYDLSGQGEIPLSRLRLEVTRNDDQRARAEGQRRVRWSVRLISDFHLIERRIAAAWVIRHLLARELGTTRPTRWDYIRAIRRLERVAWSNDDARVVAPALARIDALRTMGGLDRYLEPISPAIGSSGGLRSFR